MATAPRKTYRKPAAPKKVGAVVVANNNYSFTPYFDGLYYASTPV